MVLLVVVIQLTGQFKFALLLLEPTPHQHLEPGQLQPSQLKLLDVHLQDSLPPFHIPLDVSLVIDDAVQLDFIVLGAEFILDFLKGA